MKIGIVVGHTRLSPGKLSPWLQVHEYPWNCDLADLMLSAAPPGHGFRVFFRDGQGITGAYRQADEWGADRTVELHFNAFAPAASGTLTLYAPGSKRGRWLAGVVQERMVAVLGLQDRGAVEPMGDRGLASLTAIPAPAILVEPFFGTNRVDCEVATARKAELAAAIVRGMVEVPPIS